MPRRGNHIRNDKLQKETNNAIQQRNLLGLSLRELKEVAVQLGMPSFTGGQIAKWLYESHVGSIDEMTNISKKEQGTAGRGVFHRRHVPAGCTALCGWDGEIPLPDLLG